MMSASVLVIGDEGKLTIIAAQLGEEQRILRGPNWDLRRLEPLETGQDAGLNKLDKPSVND
jgi:hypothetical protein